METDFAYISADSHVVEPVDLWTQRMDRRFRDRAPRLESLPDNDYYIIDGLPPMAVGLEGEMMESKLKGGIDTIKGRRYSNTRPGAWDPHPRLADQELDNIRAEVIYGGPFALQLIAAPDAEYVRECTRVYNDWLAEFCAAAPARLIGVASLPMKGPVEWAIEEAERVVKKGLRSVSVPTEIPERPYRVEEYDRLWTALQALDLPLAVHTGTTTGEALPTKFRRMGVGPAVLDSKLLSAIRVTSELVWNGIPQKFPKLKIVLVEGGIGWIAPVLTMMDHWWKDHHRWMRPHLEESPSFYFKRNFWATFEDDRPGILTRELLNLDRLLWGSDYPHTEGTFPHSREQIAKDFAGVPADEVRKMVADNAARFYGLSA